MGLFKIYFEIISDPIFKSIVEYLFTQGSVSGIEFRFTGAVITFRQSPTHEDIQFIESRLIELNKRIKQLARREAYPNMACYLKWGLFIILLAIIICLKTVLENYRSEAFFNFTDLSAYSLLIAILIPTVIIFSYLKFYLRRNYYL